MTQTPSKLVTAMAAVMRDIHRLKKDERNAHGGYNYVSVDDVKDLIRPLLAENGLDVTMTETAHELLLVKSSKGETSTVKVTFSVVVHHVSGEASEPEQITVMLPYTGAQTTGAARSYAIKEWSKTRLLVSTGEKDMVVGGNDADAYAQQDYTASTKSSYRAKKDGDDKEFKRIMEGLRTIEDTGSLDDLKLFWSSNQTKIKEMPVGWVQELSAEKDRIKKLFEEGAERPIGFDPNTGEILKNMGDVPLDEEAEDGR